MFRGEGCVIDLGRNHPMGSVGFVRYDWLDVDKALFDRTGRPPVWAGKLHNNVPMVTIQIQYSRWRQGYAPHEGTLGEVRHYRDAHPCLVVCTAFPREMNHLQDQRWVVPSECMPEVQVGEVKQPGSTRKMALFLRDKKAPEVFHVNDSDLHATIQQFVLGSRNVTIGFGKAEVQKAAYLKNIGDYKFSCDVNFEKCISGHKYRGTNV